MMSRCMMITSLPCSVGYVFFFFFFNDTATTEIYTLSLHDALPISDRSRGASPQPLRQAGDHEPDLVGGGGQPLVDRAEGVAEQDRKSTRLNSSHANISYAVFCLKKKKNTIHNIFRQAPGYRERQRP